MKNKITFFVFLGALVLGLAFPRVHDAQEKPPELRIHFIDVGYGDAVLIQAPGGANILIDAADRAHAKRIHQYLRVQGIQEIHTVIITHPHANHFGGLVSLAKKVPVRQVFINRDSRSDPGYTTTLNFLAKKGIPVIPADVDTPQILIDAWTALRFLHPPTIKGAVNDNALVCWLTFGQASFLFTADIGAPVLAALQTKFPEILSSGCIQIPHHGRTIAPDLLARFRGPYFVASTGANPWEMPSKEKLKAVTGQVLRTDGEGTIVLISDGKTLRREGGQHAP